MTQTNQALYLGSPQSNQTLVYQKSLRGGIDQSLLDRVGHISWPLSFGNESPWIVASAASPRTASACLLP